MDPAVSLVFLLLDGKRSVSPGDLSMICLSMKIHMQTYKHRDDMDV